MWAQAFFFWIFAAVLVGSALAVILARNPVHSVLFLILALRQRGRPVRAARRRVPRR